MMDRTSFVPLPVPAKELFHRARQALDKGGLPQDALDYIAALPEGRLALAAIAMVLSSVCDSALKDGSAAPCLLYVMKDGDVHNVYHIPQMYDGRDPKVRDEEIRAFLAEENASGYMMSAEAITTTIRIPKDQDFDPKLLEDAKWIHDLADKQGATTAVVLRGEYKKDNEFFFATLTVVPTPHKGDRARSIAPNVSPAPVIGKDKNVFPEEIRGTMKPLLNCDPPGTNKDYTGSSPWSKTFH